MDTPNPSWIEEKIANFRLHPQFDYRSPLPPEECIYRLNQEVEATPYNLSLTTELRNTDAFYFRLAEDSRVGIQVEGHITSLGNGSLVDGRIHRPGRVLTWLVLFINIPLFLLGWWLFVLSFIAFDTGLLSAAIMTLIADLFFWYIFAFYSRRHRNYLRLIESAVTTKSQHKKKMNAP